MGIRMGLRHRGVHVLGVRGRSHREYSYPGSRRRKTIPRPCFPRNVRWREGTTLMVKFRKTTISLGTYPCWVLSTLSKGVQCSE